MIRHRRPFLNRFSFRISTKHYEDCLAQVHEILQKYGTSHHVIVGGDFNEDISNGKIPEESAA